MYIKTVQTGTAFLYFLEMSRVKKVSLTTFRNIKEINYVYIMYNITKLLMLLFLG